jgi:hypothetical protein
MASNASPEETLATLVARREQLAGKQNKSRRLKVNQRLAALCAEHNLPPPPPSSSSSSSSASASSSSSTTTSLVVASNITADDDEHDKPPLRPGNFCATSEPGCHVAFHDAEWLIDKQPFSATEFGLRPGDKCPDMSIDPESGLFSCINATKSTLSFFVTFGHQLHDARNVPLSCGVCRDSSGVRRRVTTVVCVLQPLTIFDVCFVGNRFKPLPQHDNDDETNGDGGNFCNNDDGAVAVENECESGNWGTQGRTVDVASDIKAVVPHPAPRAFDKKHTYAFPLPTTTMMTATTTEAAAANATGGVADSVGGGGASVSPRPSYLCSQGHGGCFTHFFRGTHHAIDLECAGKCFYYTIPFHSVLSLAHRPIYNLFTHIIYAILSHHNFMYNSPPHAQSARLCSPSAAASSLT